MFIFHLNVFRIVTWRRLFIYACLALMFLLVLVMTLVKTAENYPYLELPWTEPHRKILTQGGYTLIVAPATSYDYAMPVYCEVSKEGRILFDFHSIGYAQRNYSVENLKIIEIEDGQLVALVDKHNEDVLLAIYDFEKDMFWTGFKEDFIGLEMLKRLERITENEFKLSSHVPGNRNTEIGL